MSGNKKGLVNPVEKLTTAQKAGVIAVMGSFKTTLADSLYAHATLLPIELKIDKICFNAINHPLRASSPCASQEKHSMAGEEATLPTSQTHTILFFLNSICNSYKYVERT